MIFTFSIPGKPCGKQRPKFGAGRTYTPEKTVNYENLVKLRFKQAYPNAEPIAAKVPIMARVTAYYPIPANTTKKKLDDIKCGLVRPTNKPDTDNIAKICLDALNGIAYHDDAQIVRLFVEKWYSTEPHVRIEIAEW